MLQKCAKVIGVSKLMYGCWIANGTSVPALPCPVLLFLFRSHKPCSIWGPWPGIQAGGWGRAPASALCSIKFWHFLIEFRCTSSRRTQTKANKPKIKLQQKSESNEIFHTAHTHSTFTHTMRASHLCEANLALASTSMSGWTCCTTLNRVQHTWSA